MIPVAVTAELEELIEAGLVRRCDGGERRARHGVSTMRGRSRISTGGELVIPNVTRGAKTDGVLRYLVGKGKREEHEHPHLVAGSPEAVRIGGRARAERADAGELARFLDEPREQFGTQVTIAERDKETGA